MLGLTTTLLTSIAMPNTNDTNGNKHPPDDVDQEIAFFQGLSDNGIPAWAQRVPEDYLARWVAEVTLRCQQAGQYVPTLMEGMAAMFGGSISPERVPDLVMAWEDVGKKFYDLSQAKCVSLPKPTKTSSAPGQRALTDLSSLQQEIQNLKSQLKSSSKARGKHIEMQYKDRPITEEVIEEFLEELGVAKWMHGLADLIKKAVDSDILDGPTLPVADLYHSLWYGKSPPRASSKRSSRGPRKSKRTQSSRRRAGTPSTSASGASSLEKS